ncbi:glycosyl hydrolase [Actinocorallia lasiicapitis]
MNRRLIGAALALLGTLVLGACGDPALDKPDVEPQDGPVKVYDVRALLKPGAMDYLGVTYEGGPGKVLEQRDELADRIGKKPNLVKYFQEWGGDLDSDAVRKMWKSGALPFIDSEPFDEPLKDIASGKFDAYLERYAAELRDTGVPVAYSMGHEFNGWWYPWGYCTPSKGLREGAEPSEACKGTSRQNKPAEFAAAWRHVHDVFVEMGATNVIWVWSPNTARADKRYNDQPGLKEFFPGDGYIDWIGISGYMREPTKKDQVAVPNPRIMKDAFGPTFTELRAFTQKPVLIAETGSDATLRKPADIRHLFHTTINSPNLIGFVWFDVRKKEFGAWVNYNINSTPQAEREFVKQVKSPRIGGDPKGLFHGG